MLSHLSLGVRDLDRSRQFYAAVLDALGCVEVWSADTAAGYGPVGGNDKLALFERGGDDRLAAGPGFHLAFRAPNQRAVHQFYEAAMSNGGSDAGEPGLRPHYGETYYAAFVLDPDGHKLEVVHQ